MASVESIFKSVYQKISVGARDPRRPIHIPHPNIEKPRMPQEVVAAAKPIVAQQDYVAIRVNQLFLIAARQWFTQIEPIVFASTEFLYGGKVRTDPFVVGPKKDQGLPQGTILRNTPIFGPHPYRGGALTLTIVLSQLPVGNIARQFLEVVESTSAVLAPSLGLSASTKMGEVVLDGFEKLLGLNGVQPLLGLRQTINPDIGDIFTPGYVALIDDHDLDPAEFWVVDDTLLRGPSRDHAVPYQSADFVLFEIARAPGGRRTDIDSLPLHQLWQRALEAAGKPAVGAWEEAKANMAVLASGITLSPDLIWTQGQELINAYIAQLKTAHEVAGKTAALGGPSATQAEHDRFARVTNILSLN